MNRLPLLGTSGASLVVLAVLASTLLFVSTPISAAWAPQPPATAKPAAPRPAATPKPDDDRPLPEEVSNSVQYSFRKFIDSSTRILPAIFAASIVLAVFWALAMIVRYVVRRAGRYIRDPTIKYLVVQVSYYVVWMLGFIVALDAVGVNPESVITALGLTGVALGFALREVLSNLVSGILILAMRLFEIGDQIVVGETEGTVEAIDLRATHIRTFDGRLVFVPNGEVSTSRVTNNSASPLRRESILIYLSYREDVARALQILLETIRGVAGIASNPAPSIQLSDLTPHHLKLEARFWADSRRADFLATVSAVRVAIVEALTKAGIELPLPMTPVAGSGSEPVVH